MTGAGSALVFGADAAAFFGAVGVGLDALVGDEGGVGDLVGGGSGEGAVELGDIDAASVKLALDGRVHGGEEFVAEFVEDFVDVDVRQDVLRDSLLLWFEAVTDGLSTRVQRGGVPGCEGKGCDVE